MVVCICNISYQNPVNHRIDAIKNCCCVFFSCVHIKISQTQFKNNPAVVRTHFNGYRKKNHHHPSIQPSPFKCKFSSQYSEDAPHTQQAIPKPRYREHILCIFSIPSNVRGFSSTIHAILTQYTNTRASEPL